MVLREEMGQNVPDCVAMTQSSDRHDNGVPVVLD